MTTTITARVPAGAPESTGGQFAATARPAVDGELIGTIDPAILLKEAGKIAASLGAKYHKVNPGDLTSDGLAAYLTAVRKLEATMDGGDLPLMLTNHHVALGYINQVMKTAAIHAQFGRMSSPDYQARRLFKAETERFTTEHGRELTAAERDALADEIRGGFEPQRRPRRDFHLNAREDVSLDVLLERPTTTVESGDRQIEDDSRLGRLEAAVNRTTAASARQRLSTKVWPALASAHNAPDIATGCGTPEQGERIAGVMRDAGGVAAAVRNFDIAEDDHPALIRLFAPFGRITTEQQYAVVETFRAAGRYGDDLYAAAMASAYTKESAE